LFPIDLKPYSDFCKISESGLNAKSMKEIGKNRKKKEK
jgi:hypothetical protein